MTDEPRPDHGQESSAPLILPPGGRGSAQDGGTHDRASAESFWNVVWRTTTKSVIVASVAGAGFVIVMLVLFVSMGAIISGVFSDDGDESPEREFVYGIESASDKLLIVRVDGVILGERTAESMFSGGVTYGYEVKETLRRAAEEEDVRGVLLWMSTPGGTIYGARAIADAVSEYKEETGNPVVAFVSGLSASGGMYGMSGADLVLADHGSLVGSIGVIFGPFKYYDGVIATEGGLLGGGITTTRGISIEYLTAGRSKDVGNPFRPLTDDERALLRSGLESEYRSFVEYVAENRDISADRIRDQIGAMVYGNSQAEALGLIDGTATREEAFDQLAELAGLQSDRFQVVEESDPGSLFGALVKDGADAQSLASLAAAAPEVCLARGTYLAYWGDPAAVCWK